MGIVIVNKTKTHVVNFDNVTEIRLMNIDSSIKINFSNGGRYDLERYDTVDEARIAMEMLCDSIGKTSYFVMPTDEQVRNKLKSKSDSIQLYGGAKPKRHGGS